MWLGQLHNIIIRRCYFRGLVAGQVDSPELLKMPETTEMTENFTKVTKYLTIFKETLINYVWKKSHV